MRDGQTSPHRPRLVVSRSTCPPLFPPHPREQLCIGTAVINTHGTAVINTLTHTAFYMGLKSKVELVAAKSSALRINLNIRGCSVVAPSPHAPSNAPLLLPLLLSHNIPPAAESIPRRVPLPTEGNMKHSLFGVAQPKIKVSRQPRRAPSAVATFR